MSEMHSETSKAMVLEVVTPQGVTFSGDVAMAVIPGVQGDLGILPLHAPLLTLLKPGMLTIKRDGGVPDEQIFVSEGFADISKGYCTVLVDEALDPRQLDKAMIEKRVEQAKYALEDARSDVERKKAEQALIVATALYHSLS